MRVQLIILLFFLCNSGIAVAQKPVNLNDSVVVWTSSRKLLRSDFQGRQDSSFLVYGYPTPGASAIKIKALVEFDGEKPYLVVLALFEKPKSWLYEEAVDRLAHEQGHFDIAELFARRMRMMAHNQPDEPEYLKKIFINISSINADLRRFQSSYDSETSHGADQKEQCRWQAIIDEKLKELKNYSVHRIQLKRI